MQNLCNQGQVGVDGNKCSLTEDIEIPSVCIDQSNHVLFPIIAPKEQRMKHFVMKSDVYQDNLDLEMKTNKFL